MSEYSQAYGKSASLTYGMLYCAIIFFLVVPIDGKIEQSNNCVTPRDGLLRGFSTFGQTWVDVLASEIKNQCSGQPVLQYSCNVEENAYRYAVMEHRLDDIEHDMYAFTSKGIKLRTEGLLQIAVQKFKQRELCDLIQKENMTVFGCTTNSYLEHDEPGTGGHLNFLLVCQVDRPKLIKEIVKSW